MPEKNLSPYTRHALVSRLATLAMEVARDPASAVADLTRPATTHRVAEHLISATEIVVSSLTARGTPGPKG